FSSLNLSLIRPLPLKHEQPKNENKTPLSPSLNLFSFLKIELRKNLKGIDIIIPLPLLLFYRRTQEMARTAPD
ncbi:unnamed protein product, partial [Linum tenue]